MDLQLYQGVITWYLPIIFLRYVFFSSPFSPKSTNMLESLPVLRYLFFLNLRLHVWLILRSGTFIAWTPTNLPSEKWFLHKNPATCLFETYRLLLFMPEKMCSRTKTLGHLAKCAGILSVKHRMHLSQPILDAPKKLWRLFKEASLSFLTDTSRSQKQCLCVVNKGTCRWQPLHIGYSECLVIQPAIKRALNPQNKEIFGSYHTCNAQKM